MTNDIIAACHDTISDFPSIFDYINEFEVLCDNDWSKGKQLSRLVATICLIPRLIDFQVHILSKYLSTMIYSPQIDIVELSLLGYNRLLYARLSCKSFPKTKSWSNTTDTHAKEVVKKIFIADKNKVFEFIEEATTESNDIPIPIK
eukprot:303058_1